LDAWAQELCVLSADAAEQLAVPEASPPAVTLEERVQRAMDVLKPRAEALDMTANAIGALNAPAAAVEFNETVHSTMSDVAAGWLDLVAAAEEAESTQDLDAANTVWIERQTAADSEVATAYQQLDADVSDALAQPADCGVLNEVR
jgi:hypothetical protein